MLVTIKEILRTEFPHLDAENIDRHSDIRKEIFSDDLEIMDLMLKLEEFFAVEIEEESLDEISNIGDLIDYIEDRL